MIIFWGTKSKKKKLGYVADYCVYCRGVQPYELSKVSAVGHIQGLSLGSGKTVGFLKRCESCSMVNAADATGYSHVFKKLPDDLHVLVVSSFPEIWDVYAERLELEDRLYNDDPISKEERAFLLREPLDAIAEEIEIRFKGEAQGDKPTGLGCVITLGVVGFLFFLGIVNEGSSIGSFLMQAAGVLGVVGFFSVFVLLLTSKQRFLKNTVYPLLGRTYSQINPSLEELEQHLQPFRNAGLALGKKIDTRKLLDAIHQARVELSQPG